MPIKSLVITTSMALTLTACAMTVERRVSADHGAQLFAANCAGCHGTAARGYDGPARDWTPPPDLTLLADRNGGVFPELLALATIDGMARHGNPDAVMPEFGLGDLGPTVVVEVEDGIGTPIPADLIALSEYLKSIQR